MSYPTGYSQTLNSVLPLDTMYTTVSQCDYGYPLIYARLNSIPDNQRWRIIVLGIIGGIGVLFYLVCLILFIIRRNVQPLKDRSPHLLMVSAISGSIALAYMYFRQFFDIVLVCPISYYITEISLFIFFVPYLLRCVRTILLWNYNEAKAATMERREDQDGGQAPLIRDDTPTSPATGGTTPIVATAKRNKSGIDTSKSATLIKYRRFFVGEGYFLLGLVIGAFIWIVGGIIIQVVSSSAGNFWNPHCQKACNDQEGFALRAFIIFVAILEIPYLLLVIYMRKINDEFSIRNELLAIIIFSSLMMIGMIILVFVPGAFWPQESSIGYLLGVTLIGTFIISVVYPLINTWVKSGMFNAIAGLAKGSNNVADIETPVSSTTDEADDSAAQKGPSTNQIEYFLTANDGKEHFKQFLVREFSVENLMFYTEVQVRFYFYIMINCFSITKRLKTITI